MSHDPPRPCTHELRPGTTVCLYCRREARLAARAATTRAALRIGGMVAGVLAAIALAVLGVSALRGHRSASPGPAEAALGAEQGSSLAIDSASAQSELPDPAPHTGAVNTAHAATAPAIAPGRIDLGNGVFAVRDGNEVTVHFDTPDTRTRRRDKFEHIVRQTLPQVFGALADSVLDRLPNGEMIPPPEVPADLSGRGIRLSLPDGRGITLWPETRPGRDGPLVVSYRASIAG